MGKIRLTLSARRDLEDIWEFIAIDNANLEAADSLIDLFAERFERLSIRPNIGEPADSFGPTTRKAIVKKRYIVFYEPEADGIMVLRVLHGLRLIQPQDLDGDKFEREED